MHSTEAARKHGAATLDELAARRQKATEKDSPASSLETHQSYALEMLEQLTIDHGARPAYAEGALWVNQDSQWRRMDVRKLRNRIAERFNGRKKADTQRAIVQIAERVCDLASAPEFFADAPIGVAARSQFWTLENGILRSCDRSPDQRQRFALSVDPDFASDGLAPIFAHFLHSTFEGPECEGAIATLQEVFGAVLFGQLATLQLAVLLLGPTRSGKGTTARLLEALLPQEATCSVAPDRWGHEYHRAALAGKRLNLVGEVDESRAIPAGDFKSIIGRDLIGARQPNHAAFTFRCEAAHIFSGNAFPEARDRDDAFYVRWLILEFPHSVAGREDASLARRLVDECLPSILAWAMKGAERLFARGRFDPTPAHARLLERWRVEHSSVLTFLCDDQVVRMQDGASTPRAHVYEAFKRWCKGNERRALGSHTFYAELRRSAGRYGIGEARDTAGTWVLRGIELLSDRDALC